MRFTFKVEIFKFSVLNLDVCFPICQTLESMLRSAKQGKPVNEEEIPPPVAIGKPAAASLPITAALEPDPALSLTEPSEPACSQSRPVDEEYPVAANEELTVKQEEPGEGIRVSKCFL